MVDLPAKDALPGARLGEGNLSPNRQLSSQLGAATEKSGAFNAVLTQGASSPNGAEASVRPDLLARTDAALRSDASARPNPNIAAALGAPASAGAGETVDLGKLDLPVLQLGSANRSVGLLQQSLALLGFETLRQDNLFGPRTDAATRSFQQGQGLVNDGVVGNRATWPAINQALVTRHEGVARLADAMGPTRAMAEPQVTEMKQLNAVLAEFGDRTAHPAMAKETVVSAERQSAAEVTYTVRGGETLADVARTFGLPIGALIAANSELSKPYLILQGQLLIVPNPVKERTYRRPPRQLHPADPEGYLASPNINPDFAALVNGMIAQLRGDGYDVRVIAGFRSFAEQQQRFEQGRRLPGRMVTDAEGGHSWHNYGLAVDIVLNDDDGRPVWPEDSSIFWQRLGDTALAHGAVWGGLAGYPEHVEYHPQFERGEAGSLIEDFESHGLDVIWERIALELPPEV